MFERFTDRARRVVVLAQEESRRLNHNYIGTEHLLLGLISESDGVAAQVLTSLGVSLDSVRLAVEDMIGRGEESPAGHIPFTPRSKKVLELSLREALSLGHNYIGTEHILLGLVREGEGVASQVLIRLGAALPVVRDRVITTLGAIQPPPNPSLRAFPLDLMFATDLIDRVRAAADAAGQSIGEWVSEAVRARLDRDAGADDPDPGD